MATKHIITTVDVLVCQKTIIVPDPVVKARWETNSSFSQLSNSLSSPNRIAAAVYGSYRAAPFVIGWGSFHGRRGYDTKDQRDTFGIYLPENNAPIYNDFIYDPIKDEDWVVPALKDLCWDKDTRLVVSPYGKGPTGNTIYCIGHYEQPVTMIGGWYDVEKRERWQMEELNREMVERQHEFMRLNAKYYHRKHQSSIYG